jgi:hypothetical protein
MHDILISFKAKLRFATKIPLTLTLSRKGRGDNTPLHPSQEGIYYFPSLDGRSVLLMTEGVGEGVIIFMILCANKSAYVFAKVFLHICLMSTAFFGLTVKSNF